MKLKTSVTDFETASALDLRKVGAWAYAEHPTTEVLCVSFELLDGRVATWAPGDDHPARLNAGIDLLELVNNPDVTFISHGDFERAIWRMIMVPVYDFSDIPNHRWHDTMAVAAMKQVPLELDLLTRVIGTTATKDREGSALTRSLSKPNKKTGMLDRSPETLKHVYQYCESDIAAEREVHDRLGWFQRGERRVWLLDQTINQRGVRIDLDYVRACKKVVDGATKPLAAEFKEITGGLSFTQRDKIMGWLKEQNAYMPDLRKETLVEALGYDIDAGEDNEIFGRSDFGLSPDARRALEIRQLVGSASVKKLDRMLVCVNSDGRARGLLQYHRAGPGRWAGRLLQPQNFPRPSLKIDGNPVPIRTIVEALMTGDWEYVETVVGPPIETVVSGLRHALVPDKGKTFISGDFSTIEARIVLSLSGQHDKTAIMAAGQDIYIDMAQQIHGRPIDKKRDPAERQDGKNSVLGLGFQMGAQKFHDRYCPDKPFEFAERVVSIYRKEWAPNVPDVWYAFDHASTQTVWTGRPHDAYGVEYALEDGWLTARLPSGRKLYYWNPKPVKREMPWSTREKPDIRGCWTYEALKNGRWKTIDAFGGLETENVVQALARDLLVAAMFRLEENGFPLVLTVHDEALAEVEGQVDEAAFGQIMSEGTEWSKAIGIPVGVETWSGDRYRK